MKSLSKGNNPKKDILSSTINLKESTTAPLSSALPTTSPYEDDTDAWNEQNERDDFDASEDSYEPEKPVWMKSGKLEQFNLPSAQDQLRKPPNGQTRWKEQPKSGFKNSNSDDNLNALLQVNCEQNDYFMSKSESFLTHTTYVGRTQEEEDLVNAHRKQVEDTMNIVKEVYLV